VKAVRLLHLVLAGAAVGLDAGSAQAPAAPRVAIFVVDGLRPDSINARDTPTIARLRGQGTEYVNSHAVFPTVTRVNAATLATGAYPTIHGIVGNSMFAAGVNGGAPFDTGDYRQLLALEKASGRVVTTETLGEILQRNGRRLVTVSSGSTGNGFLLNPQARTGAGVAIHGLFDRGATAAYPKETSDLILKRFGAPPPDPDDLGQMHWTDGVLRDYVLPELRPDVVIDWLGPLDSAQHQHGVGSPEALDALRQIDASIGRTLATVDRLGWAGRTSVVVTSDHGFAHHREGVDVVGALVAAGLKKGRETTDVIVASQGQSLLLYLPGASASTAQALVGFLQRQPWADVVFTSGGQGGLGRVPGTFSLDLIGASHPSRAPDVVVSLRWTSEQNPFGVPGGHVIHSAKTGPLTGGASGHGGLSPWVVRNTFVAWGAGVQPTSRLEAPVSLADVTPTVLALLGIKPSAGGPGRGRVLQELLVGGPARPAANVGRREIVATAGNYRATLQLSTIDDKDYVDSGARPR
jgi:arylsulfatase A-like enzyme